MRGQASVEWIIVIALALLILAIMLSFNEDNYMFFKDNMRVGKAKASLNDLKNSVDFVYSQGTGARTRLYVNVPTGSNFTVKTLPDGTGQIEATVYVGGDPEHFDVFTDANITGELPTVSGGYCVDVIYEGRQVNITRSEGSC